MDKYFNKNFYNIKSIKKLINDLSNNSYYSNDLKLSIIKNNWNDIIGNQLYNQTEPVKIFKTTLYVNCIHQGMINTLLFYKDVILNKIQQNYKNIESIDHIVFKYGPVNNLK